MFKIMEIIKTKPLDKNRSMFKIMEIIKVKPLDKNRSFHLVNILNFSCFLKDYIHTPLSYLLKISYHLSFEN